MTVCDYAMHFEVSMKSNKTVRRLAHPRRAGLGLNTLTAAKKILQRYEVLLHFAGKIPRGNSIYELLGFKRPLWRYTSSVLNVGKTYTRKTTSHTPGKKMSTIPIQKTTSLI